ncbi:MAG: hypothetical protein C5B52_01880 [Bacteroidetes bacterium]|nr:MAG: hypothetical protein C5B52_01880 [Bacteroidota bacterium]
MKKSITLMYKRKAVVGNLLLIFTCIFAMHACKHQPTPSSSETKDSIITKGKNLATLYCGSCHMYPDPSLLDKKTWAESVLPNMAPHLGIFKVSNHFYPSSRGDHNLPGNYYPDSPMISVDQWKTIEKFYVENAPKVLTIPERSKPIHMGIPLFSASTPSWKFATPTVSFVKVRTSDLLVCDVLSKKLFRLDKQLRLIDSLKTSGPIVDIETKNNRMLACNIGVLNPNNGRFGRAEYISIGANGKMKEDTTGLFGQLVRPVQVNSVDLNRDGIEDFLVCEFGYLIGGLSWMEGKKDGSFERHVLSNLPGAIKAYVRDENHDGLPDFWVLFAHGEEGIFLFLNKGNGKFDQQEIIRFPPVYGSSYFELQDINKDGFDDIIYTCGDNSDVSRILKPYHGIYIFLNDGKNHFEMKYFFRMNGCYKAMARDFDGDGDLDIAAISFFADYTNHPEEGFVYLENNGNLNFEAYSIPEAQSGRWLTMDAGDIDGDGKTDLILGNFSLPPTLTHSQVDWSRGPFILQLRNNKK